MARRNPGALSDLQERFCLEYIKDLNGAQSVIRAGYSKTGASVTANRLLSNPKIAARVSELKAESMQRIGLEADLLLRQLAEQATADLADILHGDGSVRPVHDWPLVWRQGLVSGIEAIKTGGEDDAVTILHKIRLADRTKSRELLGRHVKVGAWKENIELGASDDLIAKLERAMARGVAGQ